jgi:AcrR family transcriptional regulator
VPIESAGETGPAALLRRPRNRRGDGARLRTDLIEAAARLLGSVPAARISMRSICREAGVSAPSVYLHFRTIDEVLLEVIRMFWIELAEEMARAGAGAAHLGPRAEVAAQVAAYLGFALTGPTRYDVLFSLQPSVAFGAGDGAASPPAPVYQVLESAIVRCRAEGVRLLLEDDHDMTVLIFVVAHGRVALSHAAPGIAVNSPGRIASFVADVLDQLLMVGP